MSFKSSHKVHNTLRILLRRFSRLKVKRGERKVMRRIVGDVVKKIVNYFKDVLDEELKTMDSFYQQYA